MRDHIQQNRSFIGNCISKGHLRTVDNPWREKLLISMLDLQVSWLVKWCLPLKSPYCLYKLRTEEPCESENFQGHPKTFELLTSGILALLYNFWILVSFPLGWVVSIWRKLLYKTVLHLPPPQKREMVGDIIRILIQWIGWQWCRYLGRLSLTYLRWFQKRKHIFPDDHNGTFTASVRTAFKNSEKSEVL